MADTGLNDQRLLPEDAAHSREEPEDARAVPVWGVDAAPVSQAIPHELSTSGHHREGDSMSKPDGGPAFPTGMKNWHVDEGPLAGNSGVDYVDPGMTLRDYFAIHADKSDLQMPERTAAAMREYLGEYSNYGEIKSDWIYRCYAKARYLFADAMLAQREKP